MQSQSSTPNDLNLKIGSLGFWVREDQLDWSDNKPTVLINIIKNDGSLFIVKDDDNKLKCFHVILGKGRTDVEIDVSALFKDKAHMIVVAWDTEKSKKLSLFIDGKEEKFTHIAY
ncbi:MAG: hypothetical protein V1698_01010 [bacterium]